MSTLDQLRGYFEGRKLIIPILIGLGVAGFMLARDFDLDALKDFTWGPKAYLFIFLAILMMVFRDLGYIIRLRILSDKLLSWKQSFQLTFLWEFASAISPGIIGGTAAAFILLAQEKIGTGRSTAIVLATSFLDVLFYIITVPLILIFTGFSEHIPNIALSESNIESSILSTYIIVSYSILFIWAAVVYIGLFLRPILIRNAVRSIFSIPFLKRWKDDAKDWGDEVVVASIELKKKKFGFWASAFGATFFSWVARFAVVNFIILALGPTDGHLEIMIRQLLMWCILILPVTPGASGLAEAIFPAFLGRYFANGTLASIGALIWRLLSYYPYLIIGFVLFPIWIRRIIKKD
ncbi:flippase-like domain-containing protein [bacterium]|nr:flippase-like domain-containing protein [bacterium]